MMILMKSLINDFNDAVSCVIVVVILMTYDSTHCSY